MARVSVPTTARLASSLRVSSDNAAATRILTRLSRSSLISVALDWLDENNLPLAQPYLRQNYGDEEDDDDMDVDDFYPPARSSAALREVYTSLQARKGSKREVLDRIVDGDWRHGLTLYQLALADLQYLHDHPTSQKWSTYRILPLTPPQPDGDSSSPPSPPQIDTSSLTIPRFHPSTFLRTLSSLALPDVKAHYNFDSHRSLPLLILRIFVLDSPYATSAALSSPTSFNAARTVYVAFPHASPHVFISKPQVTSSSSPSTTSSNSSVGATAGGGGEAKSLRALLVEGIPKALSRPLKRERFALQSTSLVTRNLSEMVERRGGGRTNYAGGGWGWYAEERGRGKGRETPLDLVLPDRESEVLGDGEEMKRLGVLEGGKRAAKRARMVAAGRFGGGVRVGDGKGVERVDVVVEDAFPGGQEVEAAEGDDDGGGTRTRRKSQFETALEMAGAGEEDEEEEDAAPPKGWRPYVRLTFHGPHVFGGIRQLVECGIIDGEKMPGWMTGEEGVTIGAIRNGRIRGHKGSGL